jgi:hypothetical protein
MYNQQGVSQAKSVIENKIIAKDEEHTSVV